MKKVLLTLVLAIIAVIGCSQNVPNPGFEEWVAYGDYEDPKNWQSPNWATSGIGVFTVSKSTDAYSGTYSARMESKSILGGLFKVPGSITLGEIEIDFINQTAIIVGGIPFTKRPDKLTGFCKYFPMQGDFMQTFVLFFKHNQGTGLRDTLGFGYYSYADTIDVWSPFETEIIYNSTEEPDSMNVIIMASDILNAVHGSTLLVDSLMFEYATGIKEPVLPIERVVAYPNPCYQHLTFEIPEDWENSELKIFNSTGQTMYAETFRNKHCTIVTGSYPKGVYFYQIMSALKSKSGSFIVSY